MEAAPATSTDWKTALLAGRIDPAVAAAAGRTLGAIIRATFQQPSWESQFGDQTVFDELRLDPYYRFTAARHPDCAQHLHALIESCRTRRVALVHGDWSPKNLLLTPAGVMAIDFEVVHYGNPCFDTGFLLCHLFMKSLHMPAHASALERCAAAFWSALDLESELDWILPGTIAHLGGLLLARADGKSPAEYLTPPKKDRLRHLAKRILTHPPATIEQLWLCL
jgi:5-methylthioribose kinase